MAQRSRIWKRLAAVSQPADSTTQSVSMENQPHHTEKEFDKRKKTKISKRKKKSCKQVETDSGSSSHEEDDISGSKFIFKYLIEVEMRRPEGEEERRDKQLK